MPSNAEGRASRAGPEAHFLRIIPISSLNSLDGPQHPVQGGSPVSRLRVITVGFKAGGYRPEIVASCHYGGYTRRRIPNRQLSACVG
jgi:hypothetical protein